LAVASSAASSYRKIEVLLAPHLGDIEAGSWAERITSGHDIAVAPDVDASAAVFAGPTWSELGRAPPTAEDLHRTSTSGPDEWEQLISTLRSKASWGERGLFTAMRTRALRHVVAETTTLLKRREASKAALLRLGGEVRRTMLEQGARLTEQGVLDDPADVELLTMNEIRSAFAGRPVPPNTLAGRRRWLQRFAAEPPLPRVFVGVPEHEPVELPEGADRIDGWAASPGSYTGTARVVSDPGDAFEAGAILVAEATDASWSPLFLQAGAIIVERGGPLSHAAILARELGVPAVLNVQGASRVLDGRRLTVDGDAGIVVLLDSTDDVESAAHSEGSRQ
jgi:pyruvate,water dikinase